MLVWSAILLMISTILPISCELFAQALNQGARFLNVAANVVHTVDGIAHLLRAFTRNTDGIAGNFRRVIGTHCHTVKRAYHVADNFGNGVDFLRLLGRRILHLLGNQASAVRRIRYLGRGTVNSTNQFAHGFDRVVDGIGNGPGEIFSHLRFYGQIAIGKFGQFVHQAENGILIAFGAEFGFGRNVLDFGILLANEFIPEESGATGNDYRQRQ